MAHFAEIDNSSIVVRVIVIPDEQEAQGTSFITETLKLPGTWVQTSYTKRIRKNYAGIGYTYDPVRDAFIPPCPGEGWTLNEETCLWEPPVE